MYSTNLSLLASLVATLLLSSTHSFAPPTTTARISRAVLAEQSDYGQTVELPTTYAQCGSCQSAFALKEEDLGANGKGRYEIMSCV